MPLLANHIIEITIPYQGVRTERIKLTFIVEHSFLLDVELNFSKLNLLL